MAELHLIRLRHFGVFRFGNGLFLQNAVDTRHAFVDLLGVSAQERQFVDGRSHTRSMMMKNSHTAANASDCGFPCISRIPTEE